MSALMETEIGGEMIVIRDVHPILDGKRQRVALGERVRLLGARYEADPPENPLGWILTVERLPGGEQFTIGDWAVVTPEHWQEIHDHITDALRKQIDGYLRRAAKRQVQTSAGK